MANGLPRSERYQGLTSAQHFRALDSDLDALDAARETLLEHRDTFLAEQFADMNKKLNYVLTTFISLIILVCGTLLATVLRT